MLLLNDLLPPSQHEMFWTIVGSNYEGLPDGQEYVCLEYFCDNPRCDCHTITVDIVSVEDDRKGIQNSLAIIEYDWSTPKSRCRPILKKESPKTKTALILLEAYKDFIHCEDYLHRIKTHYKRVKALAAAKQKKPLIYENNKVRRNDPCTCGSGRKYKKCCLYKNTAVT